MTFQIFEAPNQKNGTKKVSRDPSAKIEFMDYRPLIFLILILLPIISGLLEYTLEKTRTEIPLPFNLTPHDITHYLILASLLCLGGWALIELLSRAFKPFLPF